jgi:hypothetical protein
MMRTFEFDKKIYSRQYACIYTILQYIFLPGFFIGIGIVIANAMFRFRLAMPPIITDVFGIYLTISMFGYVIASLLKIGMRRLIQNSELSYDGKKIVYDRLTKNQYTGVGHVEEHEIYTINKADSIAKTKRFYIITGDMTKEVINNGRELSMDKIGIVKIPFAYSNMDECRLGKIGK